MIENGKVDKAVKVGVGAGIGAGIFGTLYTIDPNWVVNHLNATMQSQVTQYAVAFSIAAWIHSGRVKKEIKYNFESLVTSIENVAKAFHERVGLLENHMIDVKSRIQSLEDLTKLGEEKHD